MNAGRLMRWGQFLLARQHAVLVALLALLHLALLAGTGSPIGLTCWLVDVGLFLLWQPFVATERRLSLASVLLLFALVGAGAVAGVIGGLFGQQGTSKSRDELVVLITPTVVRSPMEARELTDEYGRRFRALDPINQPKAK